MAASPVTGPMPPNLKLASDTAASAVASAGGSVAVAVAAELPQPAMRQTHTAITITREMSFFILFSLKKYLYKKSAPTKMAGADLKYTGSNHCTNSISGRAGHKEPPSMTITLIMRIIIRRRTAKMDTAKAVSRVSRRALLSAGREERAQKDSFAAAHERQSSVRFSKRFDISSRLPSERCP